VGGALNTIAGYESIQTIRKGQIRWLAKADVVGQIRFIHQIYGIACMTSGPAEFERFPEPQRFATQPEYAYLFSSVL